MPNLRAYQPHLDQSYQQEEQIEQETFHLIQQPSHFPDISASTNSASGTFRNNDDNNDLANKNCDNSKISLDYQNHRFASHPTDIATSSSSSIDCGCDKSDMKPGSNTAPLIDTITSLNNNFDTNYNDNNNVSSNIHSRHYSAKNRLSSATNLHHRSQVYVLDSDHSVTFSGYSVSRTRLIVYHLFCVLSGGLLFLFGRWFVGLYLRLVCVPCKLRHSQLIHARNSWGQEEIIKVEKCRFENGNLLRLLHLRDRSPSPSALLEDSNNHEYGYMTKFEYNCRTFILNPQTGWFFENSSWSNPVPRSMDSVRKGLSFVEYQERHALFASNQIEIPQKSSFKILVDELLHPFNVFQVFSIGVWIAENYFYYAGCLVLISIISLAKALQESKRNYERLREISRFHCDLRVLRNNEWQIISSDDLVPGDVYEVSPYLTTFPCDSILLSGDCIVNESMITGESVPVFKLPSLSLDIEPNYQNLRIDQRYYLFGGTKVVRLRQPQDENEQHTEALALAVRTGFNSTKGTLVRSMLFPRPNKLKFYKDSLKFIGVLAIIAGIGFIVTAAWFIIKQMPAGSIALKSLDLITIIIPPILPAAMLIGTSFALARLRKKNIFCISPPRINVSGKIDVVVFDKTGTLTEDNLDLTGVQVACPEDKLFHEIATSIDSVASLANADLSIVHALACCHSMNMVHGKLIGDPMDLQMFSFTKWRFEESNNSVSTSTIVRSPVYSFPAGYELLHCYEFVSGLRRMSVIARSLESGKSFVFTKGAPEVMGDICIPGSLPQDFHSVLDIHVQKGHRVLGVAAKAIDNIGPSIDRNLVEKSLYFLGFIVYENKLKKETTGVLSVLRNSRIRSIMCTGDNIQTAVSIARECGIIQPSSAVFVPMVTRSDPTSMGIITWKCFERPDLTLDPRTLDCFSDDRQFPQVLESPSAGPDEILLKNTAKSKSSDDLEASSRPVIYSDYALALTGDIFSQLLENASKETITRVLVRGQVFARMSPDEKAHLILQLQEIGYCCAMCGDGANDTSALTCADVGVSLSEAEASVAAPFTSRSSSIECILDIIREGRAALVTSFSCFKYIALYSNIQFISVILMYTTCRTLGDFQFLFTDLALILPMAFIMGRTEARQEIHPKRPTSSLVSKKVLVSLIGQIIIALSFQILIFFTTKRQFPACTSTALTSPENTTLFLLTCFQYLWIAIIFSVGYPYRARLLQNTLFVLLFVVLTLITTIITTFPTFIIFSPLQLYDISSFEKAYVICLALLNFLVAYLCEHNLFPRLIKAYQYIRDRHNATFYRGHRKSKRPFKIALEEMGLR